MPVKPVWVEESSAQQPKMMMYGAMCGFSQGTDERCRNKKLVALKTLPSQILDFYSSILGIRLENKWSWKKKEEKQQQQPFCKVSKILFFVPFHPHTPFFLWIRFIQFKKQQVFTQKTELVFCISPKNVTKTTPPSLYSTSDTVSCFGRQQLWSLNADPHWQSVPCASDQALAFSLGVCPDTLRSITARPYNFQVHRSEEAGCSMWGR